MIRLTCLVLNITLFIRETGCAQMESLKRSDALPTRCTKPTKKDDMGAFGKAFLSKYISRAFIYYVLKMLWIRCRTTTAHTFGHLILFVNPEQSGASNYADAEWFSARNTAVNNTCGRATDCGSGQKFTDGSTLSRIRSLNKIRRRQRRLLWSRIVSVAEKIDGVLMVVWCNSSA